MIEIVGPEVVAAGAKVDVGTLPTRPTVAEYADTRTSNAFYVRVEYAARGVV